MSLLENLSKQLGGAPEFQNDKGVRFTVKFPVGKGAGAA